MILKYYRGYVSLDKLSEMMNTTKDGTTAYNIKETLNSLGFNSYGLKSENLKYLEFPCIAHVLINHSYKHYIVIYKVNLKKQTMLIADPATNLKHISFKEFNQIWSGITIHMHPTTHIVYESKPKTLKFIWYYLKRHIFIVILIQILSIILSLLTLVSEMFFPVTISFLKNQIWLFKILLLYLFIFIFKNVFLLIKDKLIIKFNLDLWKELQTDIFKKILNLPYRYYRRKTTGEITSYFNDIYIIRNAISNFIQISLVELPLILLLIFFIFKLNITLLLLTIIIIIFIIGVTLIFQKKQNIWMNESMRNKALMNSYITENIMGFETLKNLNITGKIYHKFKGKYQMCLNSDKKLYISNSNSEFLKNTISDLGILLITLIIVNMNADLNLFIISFILIMFLISAVRNILTFNYQISEINSSLINITELINKKSENKNIINSFGDIVISNLNYSYNKTYVLKNINLTISKSSKVMVTGSSGSGKSTLFKIIKGYYNDYEGNVKINGFEVKTHSLNGLLYISQKEILFTGTLDENLSLKEKNLNSIKICEIDEFAKDNYNQLIEEDGFNLSGGQRQRIVLARALNNFDILIIDEGLNQVSVDMERRILKNLFAHYPNKTIIYISHRLDNLDMFQQYIKLEKGKVVINTKRNN